MRPSTLGLIGTLALDLLVGSLAADAQPPAPVYRIGRLSSGHPPLGADPNAEAFRQGLRDLGWIEGQNIAFEHRYAEEQAVRLPALAAELVQLPVHVIFAVGAAAIRAAQLATPTIPIVMLVGGDPVGSGLITSVTRPGGNVTGIATLSPKLSAQRLALLKEVVPRAAQVAILFNPDDETKVVEWHQTQVAARTLGLQIQPREVRGPDDLGPAFAAMSQERTGGLVILSDAVTLRYRTRIVHLAAEHRVPAIYEFREFVEAGGLMAYGPRLPILFQRAASYIDRLLKGANPADLPVEQPTSFELIINLNTAQALGLTVPSSLLFLVDEVIR
jgi:putative tryptophan/tyrosine transport system substrate-binding protein